jgi:hypothetical protein
LAKVLVLKSVSKDSFPVMAATVTTGWIPGTAFTLNSLGYAIQANVDETMFIGMDDETEVVAPPSGSLLTALYGSGTRIQIDHTTEVAAGSSTYAFDSSVLSSIRGQDLYIGTDGKFTTTVTGSVKAKVVQVPAAANNYTLDCILRF